MSLLDEADGSDIVTEEEAEYIDDVALVEAWEI